MIIGLLVVLTYYIIVNHKAGRGKFAANSKGGKAMKTLGGMNIFFVLFVFISLY